MCGYVAKLSQKNNNVDVLVALLRVLVMYKCDYSYSSYLYKQFLLYIFYSDKVNTVS